ncbi:MAG: peptidylprolyl isomerase [Actinophytocola sp.]|uniref:peptidylprolyl isomerase n=1 Tax=Actinophytocola sp. TaxID=1872138 RepID=UPI00132C8D62|nr:peptidylprolyl isomerase [Actinophytocola sp.]MPZ83854.1 peptidylprolyl isomerase [Actinophytocola sp.]
MPSNEQRRQAAKRKLERQLARRAERTKRRRVWGVGLTVIVVVAVVGLVYWLANLGPEDSEASTNPTDTESAGETTDGPCAYAESAADTPPKDVGMPEDPAETPKTGTVKVTLKTNQGEIPVTLDRAKAPCTVQSIEHLVKEKFYDGTTCHRITASAGLKVLQCGDPKGDGTGGPGYSIPDELPQDLTDAPADPSGQPLKLYERGMLAMANGGPNTGGSQYFMVYDDSTLPPNYTVFGEVSESGLKIIDKIAKAGITPGNSPEDGAPKSPVQVESATVAD